MDSVCVLKSGYEKRSTHTTSLFIKHKYSISWSALQCHCASACAIGNYKDTIDSSLQSRLHRDIKPAISEEVEVSSSEK